MNWKTNIITIIVLFFVSCGKEKETETIEKETKSFSGLVHTADLDREFDGSSIKFIDFSNKETYLKAHLPDAIHLTRADIETTSYPYKGMRIEKKDLEKLLSNLGIKNEDTIIVYDDNSSVNAARFWWVMKSYGFDNIAILNGGIKAWENDNRFTSNSTPKQEKSDFIFPEQEFTGLATKKDVTASLNNANAYIIDTRTADEYSGKRQKKGAFRAGRIPKSTFIDWVNAIDYEDSQLFKSKAELEKIYNTKGWSTDHEIIAYCHTGVRSAHTYFVLTELLGYKNVKNYDGSWSEWSYFNDLPISKDSITRLNK
ncbi:MAG: sulfurtransferase [Flavobacteriaceae bacterium]|nr:sulfurtransferase [Flavobacteriaceae bacterium]